MAGENWQVNPYTPQTGQYKAAVAEITTPWAQYAQINASKENAEANRKAAAEKAKAKAAEESPSLLKLWSAAGIKDDNDKQDNPYFAEKLNNMFAMAYEGRRKKLPYIAIEEQVLREAEAYNREIMQSKASAEQKKKIAEGFLAHGVSAYRNTDVITEMEGGKFKTTWEGKEKEYDINNVGKDYTMTEYLAAKEHKLSEVKLNFDIPKHMQALEASIKNAVTTETKLDAGGTSKSTMTQDDKIVSELNKVWNDTPEVKDQNDYNFRQAQTNNPDLVLANGKKVSEITDPKDYFIQSYLPQFRQKDQTIEGGSGGDSAGSLAMKNVLTNNNQGHTMGFSMSDAKGDIVEYNTPAAMRLSLVPSDVNISTGGGMFNKETGEEMKGGASVKATVGEIALAPVYKNVQKVMGIDINGRPVMAEELDARKKKGEVEYKVIYTGETKEGEFIYGDISQVESSLFSKESPITDKAAFSKSLDEMKAEAKRLNGGSQKKNEAKTIATKIQSTQDPKKFKITYTDGTSEIITE